MVRTILTPENTHIELDIPAEYVGKKIEITYLALDEITKASFAKKTMADFWGILSDESADKLRNEIQTSRNEWERDI